MEVKDQIKRSISIVDVVSLYVNLKPAGKNYKGLCPFHTEKTASFFVMPEKESFVCYGCNKFGDIFTIVQEMENLNFPEAMNFLIDRFNLQVERANRQRSVKKDEYMTINDLALKFFRDNLTDTDEGRRATEYLRKRGISSATIEEFALGYALNSWDGLYLFLKKKSCHIGKAVDLGLLVKKDQSRVYDRFRGRIIFPIFSESGSVIAFGGRTLFDDSAKYLNSPDNPLYKKSRNLFGFHLSKKHMREINSAVIVEGYFDMISLYQAGVKNTVASLGTALTEDQVKTVKRFADDIYLFYDSDQAGITATVRGIEKMFELDINPRVIVNPEAKDPDDFIRAHGLKKFNEILKKAVPGFRFLLEKVSNEFDLKIPERKRDAIEKIRNFLNKFGDPLIRTEYSQQAADFFGVDVNLIKLENKGHAFGVPGTNRLNITPAERDFIEAIMLAPELIEQFQDMMSGEILALLSSKNIIRAIFRSYNPESKQIGDFKAMLDLLTDSERRELREIYGAKESVSADSFQMAQVAGGSFLEFQNKLNQKRISEINRQIQIKVKEAKFDEVEKLMNRKNQFIQAIHKKSAGGIVG